MSRSGSGEFARSRSSLPPSFLRSSSGSSLPRGFPAQLLLRATIGAAVSAFIATGEETGWRGYMLTRLIDGGVPFPVLVSGVIWGYRTFP
jgi:membrane protease YdiL (CAAX protease family)